MSNSDENLLEQEGSVTKAAGNGRFVVETDAGTEVKCVISGRMRKNNIKVVEGDAVKIVVSLYDLTNGRIVRRMRKEE